MSALPAELWLRLGLFLGLLLALGLAESVWARRTRQVRRRQRWPVNFAIVVIDSLILRLLPAVSAVGAAAWAAQHDWGLLALWPVPGGIAIALSLLALDAAIYLQHRLMHKLPLLWRLHRMHHSDVEIDVSTALRFHPLEILLSMLYKMALVVLLGAPVVAVVSFEILLNGTAMFNHANLRLPPRLDHALRWLLVTPDMHRVHHSWHPRETNSNFGFNLPWWDRLFGTYIDQPRDGHLQMHIGLHAFRQPQEQNLKALLFQPWTAETRP